MYMIIFDYVFYRLARYYAYSSNLRWDALTQLSFVQTVLFFELLVLIIKQCYSQEQSKEYISSSVVFVFIFGIVITIFNRYRYKGNFWKYEARWGDIPFKTSLFLAVLVILFNFLPLAMFFFIVDFM